jgi:hypothetical protein
VRTLQASLSKAPRTQAHDLGTDWSDRDFIWPALGLSSPVSHSFHQRDMEGGPCFSQAAAMGNGKGVGCWRPHTAAYTPILYTVATLKDSGMACHDMRERERAACSWGLPPPSLAREPARLGGG